MAQYNRSLNILCFEPDPQIVPHLKKNVAINRFDNIEIIQKALSDQQGFLPLTKGLGAQGYLLQASGASGTPLGTVEVPVVTLDQELMERGISKVDFIKVDIEGGELCFLRGAEQTLRTSKPLILIEVNDSHLRRSGSNRLEVLEHLESQGYVVFQVQRSFDYLAVDPEESERFAGYDWLDVLSS